MFGTRTPPVEHSTALPASYDYNTDISYLQDSSNILEIEDIDFTETQDILDSPGLITGRNSDLVFCPIRFAASLDTFTIYISLAIPNILGPILCVLLAILSLPCRRAPTTPSSSCCSKFCSCLLLICLVTAQIGCYYTHLILR